MSDVYECVGVRVSDEDLFSVTYTNNYLGYIPSLRVLREGGYEGYSSQRIYGLPSTGEPGIETRIMSEVLQMTQEMGIVAPPRPLRAGS